MPLAILPILLLVVPILEIATFILVGRAIGLLPTLGLVVVSAVVGALLLKRQGLQTLRQIQAETAAGRVPGRELVNGVMIVAAGILLLTPGLVTDVFGYLLFVPAVRDGVWRFLKSRVRVTATMSDFRRPAGAGARPDPHRDRDRDRTVVDLEAGDYERRDADPNSPWSPSHDGNRTLH